MNLLEDTVDVDGESLSTSALGGGGGLLGDSLGGGSTSGFLGSHFEKTKIN